MRELHELSDRWPRDTSDLREVHTAREVRTVLFRQILSELQALTTFMVGHSNLRIRATGTLINLCSTSRSVRTHKRWLSYMSKGSTQRIRKAREIRVYTGYDRHTRWQRARSQSALATCTTRAGELLEIGCKGPCAACIIHKTCVRPFHTER